MTQATIDAQIDFCISLAIQCEEIRDGCEHESKEYWEWQDRAMTWHWRAEQLMPKSGRTISVEDFS